MANQFVDVIIGDDGIPVEAVVLRGYLAAPESEAILAKLRKDGVSQATLNAVRKALKLNQNRIYLSAKFDRWVDFHNDDLIRREPADDADANQRDDWSTTVWLRVPRLRPRAEQYKLVTRTTLATDDGFVRGKLVDDFMDDPASQVVWEEQGYLTAKPRPSTIFCTA